MLEVQISKMILLDDLVVMKLKMEFKNLNDVEIMAQKYALDLDYLDSYLNEILVDGNFKNNSDKYFWERILEISQESSNDVWVSRWELKGLLSRLEEKDNQFRGQESHLGGIHGPSIPHYNVTGRDLYGRKFKKHLFITEDPNDLRLARLDSYNTNHPSE